jgi:hypothetical protein
MRPLCQRQQRSSFSSSAIKDLERNKINSEMIGSGQVLFGCLLDRPFSKPVIAAQWIIRASRNADYVAAPGGFARFTRIDLGRSEGMWLRSARRGLPRRKSCRCRSRAAGAERVFREKISGAVTDRKMAVLGYARVSTDGQTLDTQVS